MRRLLLLRHGKSAWPDGVADHERPLAPRGEFAVPLIARHLAGLGLAIDLALVSDARRTRETYALFGKDMPGIATRSEPRIYDARPSTLLALINALPDSAETVLMVGHNPGFQAIALHLADPKASEADALWRLERKYPTAGLAMLDLPGRWAEADHGRAVLSAFITPAMLGGRDED